MNAEEERFALFALSELPGVGERTLLRLQAEAKRHRHPLRKTLVLPASVLSEEYGLPQAAIRRLTEEHREHDSRCRETLERLTRSEVSVLGPEDSTFPQRWKERGTPCPPIVHQYGNLRILAGPTIAVLSSRDVTERSVLATVQVTRAAARDGFALVSGGMKATHRIASVSGRATGTKRVIVLDRGILATFGIDFGRDPFGFSPGRARFDAAACLVLSPFRPRDHASPRSGRRRDELVADLADLIIAAQARVGGEIERICLRALDRGQPVLSWEAENSSLIAAGAGAIDEADLQYGLDRFVRSPTQPRPED